MADTDRSKTILDTVDRSIFSTRKFADLAADIIRQMILANEVEPGERLNEINLAQRLGISRSPVREALQSLAGEGLVHFVSGRGAFVVELGPETVRQVGQIGAALESLGAELAAAVATDAQIRELRRVHVATKTAMDASGHTYDSSHDFHRTVLEISGNPRLVEVSAAFSAQSRLARIRSAPHSTRARDAYLEHEEILVAIESRDPEAAGAAMKRHSRLVLTNVLALLAERT